MENYHKEYVYLDSLWLKEDKVLQLAYNAGSWDKAEHYLFAYLANAVINGNLKAIERVNEVRASYGVKPIPFKEDNGSGDHLHRKKVVSSADLAREKYTHMNWEKRKEVLMASLVDIMNLHLVLFKSSAYWNGIFLVIRDRVDGKLKKTEFAGLAELITPESWPKSLVISKTTLNNFSHYLDLSDREEAYYDMANNPWEDLCEKFWEILEQHILTNV